MIGFLFALFLTQLIVRRTLVKRVKNLISLFLPGNDSRRSEKKIVRRPWPGRNNIAMPQNNRMKPKKLRIRQRHKDFKLYALAFGWIAVNCRK